MNDLWAQTWLVTDSGRMFRHGGLYLLLFPSVCVELERAGRRGLHRSRPPGGAAKARASCLLSHNRTPGWQDAPPTSHCCSSSALARFWWKQPKGTCSKSHVRGILAPRLDLCHGHMSGPRRRPVLHRQTASPPTPLLSDSFL